jgi:CHAT domain-containing protein
MRETASETRFKTEAGKARILHFATHGLFDPLHGMYSGLVLSLDAPPSTHPLPPTLTTTTTSHQILEDGYLEAREVVDLELNAELVVLSACETARGQLSRGEGVIGLSWAFFVAGCPSTVVSQWKVADTSTAQLMAAFYRNLRAGKGKAESLRQAQLSFLLPNPKSKTKTPKWDHPFYWSPFILVGDWQ